MPLGVIMSKKSVLNECRDKTLAFWHDRVTPRTPKASKATANAWPLSGQ